MRTFHAYVDEKTGKVGCKPPTMHVPHGYEEFAVYLDDKWVRKYKLFVDIDGASEACIEKQRLNTSAIVLKDDNTAPCEAKFSIELKPLPGSRAPGVKPLDPIFVNE